MRLIDTWDWDPLFQLITFRRQSVYLSGEIVPFWVIFSDSLAGTWVIISVKLSPCRGT